jgi:hypothetical protein
MKSIITKRPFSCEKPGDCPTEKHAFLGSAANVNDRDLKKAFLPVNVRGNSNSRLQIISWHKRRLQRASSSDDADSAMIRVNQHLEKICLAAVSES